MLRSVQHLIGSKNRAVSIAQRYTIGSRASMVGIVLNTLLCAAKAAIGLMAGSISIVADALNNLSDAASNVISLLGFKLARKPADADHPYGHGRYEYLAGLFVAILVLVVGVELARESITKLLHPAPIEYSTALVVVLILSVVVKVWMMVFNAQVGRFLDSGVFVAASADSRNDAFTTAAVLGAIGISYSSGVNLDGWVGLMVAAFILYNGVGLIKNAIDPLLGKPADAHVVQHIENKMLSYQGILGIHDLIVHDYGPGRMFASVHAEVDASVDILVSHECIDAIEQDFLKNDGIAVVIHLDPVATNDERVDVLRRWISHDVVNIDSRLSIHDLRIVPGEHKTNVIFDCFSPYTVPIDEETLKRTITKRVVKEFPQYNCVIKIDRG